LTGPSAVAAVMTGPGKIERREMRLPETCENDGLLRIEACGVAVSDPVLFRRNDLSPAILGHQIVGTIERLGAHAAARWRAKESDRVIVQEYLPCGACEWCAKGEYRLCDAAQMEASNARRYGMTRTDVAPGLWGGFAQYLYLDPRSVIHAVPDRIPDSLATLVLPCANGIQWAVLDGQVCSGDAVVIFGCGLAGLAAARAAAEAGAASVIICGLQREKECLAAADSFGASHALIAEEEGLETKIDQLTEGHGADVVVDTTSDTSGRVAAAAIRCAAMGANLVLGGIGLVPLNLGEIRRKYLTIKPVRGHSTNAVERGLEMIAGSASAFGQLPCRQYPLGEVAAAIRAGDPEISPGLLRAEVRPWM
jgi:threonine dehydrogenase-like Zn-dependent dehydrogenase